VSQLRTQIHLFSVNGFVTKLKHNHAACQSTPIIVAPP